LVVQPLQDAGAQVVGQAGQGSAGGEADQDPLQGPPGAGIVAQLDERSVQAVERPGRLGVIRSGRFRVQGQRLLAQGVGGGVLAGAVAGVGLFEQAAGIAHRLLPLKGYALPWLTAAG
jgi:hypothetical protein